MPTKCGLESVGPQLHQAAIRGDVKTFDHVMREQVDVFLQSQIETYYRAAIERPFLNPDIYPTMLWDYQKATWDNGVMRFPRYTTTAFRAIDQVNNPSLSRWEKPSQCSELGQDQIQAYYCNQSLPTVTFQTGIAYYDAELYQGRIVSPIICLDYIKTIQDFPTYFQALVRDLAERPLDLREYHFRSLVYKNSRSVVLSKQFFDTFQFTGTGLPTTLGNATPVQATFMGWERIFNYLKYEQGLDGCVRRNGMNYLLMFISQQTYQNMLREDPYFKSNSTLAGRDIVDFFGVFSPSPTKVVSYGPYLIVVDDNVPRAHIVTDPGTGLDVLEYVDPWRNIPVSQKFGSGLGMTRDGNPDWHTAPFEPVLVTGLNAFFRTVNQQSMELWSKYIPGAGFNVGEPWQAALQAKTGTFEWINTTPNLPSFFSDDPCVLENPNGTKGGYAATVAQGISVNNPLRINLFLIPTGAQRCSSSDYVVVDFCVKGRVAEPKCELEPMAEPKCDPCANGNYLFIESTKLKADVCADNPEVTVTIRRQRCFEGVVTLNYQTVPGTAVPGTDYTTTTGSLTWADGVGGAQTITVPVLNNPLVNQNGLSFSIVLTPGANTTLEPDCSTLLAVLEQPCFPCPQDEEDEDDDDIPLPPV